MNKGQEECIAYGLNILINNSDKIKDSEKEVWNWDYKNSFPEEDGKEKDCCDMKESKQGELCNLCGFILGTREECIVCGKFVKESGEEQK